MIHSFSCENFYSVKDPVEVSFLLKGKDPVDESSSSSGNGAILSKIMTVIWPNASGKTNVLKTLPFMKWLIVDAWDNLKIGQGIPVKHFYFCDESKKREDSRLSVVFEVDGTVYIYKVEVNSSRITKEVLKVRDRTAQRTTEKTLFQREWNAEIGNYTYKNAFSIPKPAFKDMRQNASFLAATSRYDHKDSQKIADFFGKIESNVNEMGRPILSSGITNLRSSLEFFLQNPNIKSEAEALLARFDLWLSLFNIEKEVSENGRTWFIVWVKHNFWGNTYELPLLYESSGTQHLFVLLPTILNTLANGWIAVLDEFDTNLHYDMLEPIIGLFVSPKTNPKGAQMIFSSHSHRLLSVLHKFQIFLTEKDENGATSWWRLGDMEGVRADENYFAKYVAGAYGARPEINL